MMTRFPLRSPACSLEGSSADHTADNATPLVSTYLRGNSVQSNRAGSFHRIGLQQLGEEAPGTGECPDRHRRPAVFHAVIRGQRFTFPLAARGE